MSWYILQDLSRGNVLGKWDHLADKEPRKPIRTPLGRRIWRSAGKSRPLKGLLHAAIDVGDE